MYRRAMKRAFGDHKLATPQKNLDFYNDLVAQEGELADRYIRFYQVRKSPEALAQEAARIQMETGEMLDPDLPIYPNPTWTCGWDCPYKDPCLEYMDGIYPEDMLATEFKPREDRPETWFEEEVNTWQDSQ